MASIEEAQPPASSSRPSSKLPPLPTSHRVDGKVHRKMTPVTEVSEPESHPGWGLESRAARSQLLVSQAPPVSRAEATAGERTAAESMFVQVLGVF